eukprot:TRINITY_DN15516_c0_g1_i1.p1 TRINITY_DN15516_c0_g1~~TRINITY_DN15516_c0_g1_i1.p1  ORF type:complete len:177 (+),score=49.96 TRINITY_DN15516_c0_g1_i1:36-533(+)
MEMDLSSDEEKIGLNNLPNNGFMKNVQKLSKIKNKNIKSYICTNQTQQPKRIIPDTTHPMLRMIPQQKIQQINKPAENISIKLNNRISKIEEMPTTPIQNEKRKRIINTNEQQIQDSKKSKIQKEELKDLNGYSVTELIKLCKKYNLRTTGTKSELLLRLKNLNK